MTTLYLTNSSCIQCTNSDDPLPDKVVEFCIVECVSDAGFSAGHEVLSVHLQLGHVAPWTLFIASFQPGHTHTHHMILKLSHM